MPVTVGPDEHLAVTLALASAAPVAAKPARVKVLVAYFMRPMAAYPVQLNVR